MSNRQFWFVFLFFIGFGFSPAHAQCNGVFGAGQFCGTVGGGPPAPISLLSGANVWSGVNTFTSGLVTGANVALPGTSIFMANANTIAPPGFVVAGEYLVANFVGPNSEAPLSIMDSYGTGNNCCFGAFVFRRANGTSASPTPLVNGDIIGTIDGHGNDGNTNTGQSGYITGGAAQIRFNATENWAATGNTSTNNGENLTFIGTPNGSGATGNLRLIATLLANTLTSVSETIGLSGTTNGYLTLTGGASSSAAAWTTSGLRFIASPASYTDTTSTGTVAAAYTDLFGASTVLASTATTYTNYYGSYFQDPVPSTNVTFTSYSALGADSIKINLSNAGDRLVINTNNTPTAGLDGDFHMLGTITANVNNFAAMRIEPTITGTAGGAGNHMQGDFFAPTFTPTASITSAEGTQYNVTFNPGTGAIITTGDALLIGLVTGNGAGTITTGNGLNVVPVYGSIKPTTVRGIYINNMGAPGITTSYGLYVDSQSGSSTNHGIFDAGDFAATGTVSSTDGFIANGNTGLSTVCTVTVADTLTFTLGILTGKGTHCT